MFNVFIQTLNVWNGIGCEGLPCAGIGIVVHNSNGAVVFFKTHSPLGNFSLLEAKAYGLVKALVLLLSIGIEVLIIELDAKSVVEALSRSADQTKVGGIVVKCQAILNLKCNFSMRHIRRQSNVAANTLAKKARLKACSSPSDFVSRCLINYLNFIFYEH